MGSLMRWDLINYLIEKNNYKSYVELGYFVGWSFDQIKLRYNKTAVDPNPCKTEYQKSLEYGKIDHEWSKDEMGVPELNYDYMVVKLTSDDFFAKIGKDKKWDCGFIDGLHEASQVERDIQNSLDHLSERGTIVLHDLLPPTLEHTTTGDQHGNWNGDCYKAVLKFIRDDIFGSYTVRVVDTDWGCGIIQRNEIPMEKNIDFEMYDKAIEDFNYFLENKEKLFNIITPEEFYQLYS